MACWKIYYIDSISRGKVCHTYYCGNKTRAEIIEFFGLNQPDCYWFKLEFIKDPEKL